MIFLFFLYVYFYSSDAYVVLLEWIVKCELVHFYEITRYKQLVSMRLSALIERLVCFLLVVYRTVA